MFNTDLTDPFERVKEFWSLLCTQSSLKHHDTFLYPLIEPISSTLPPDTPFPTTTFSFTVIPELTNRGGNLHGGAAALIFDVLTSCAIAPIARGPQDADERSGIKADPGLWYFPGVSRTLNVTYLRPAPKGLKVWCKCEVLSVGRRLATIRAVIVDDKGRVLCTAEHGKANTDPNPDSKL